MKLKTKRKTFTEKERQKGLKPRQREARKAENKSAAARLKHHMIPRPTAIEKVNENVAGEHDGDKNNQKKTHEQSNR